MFSSLYIIQQQQQVEETKEQPALDQPRTDQFIQELDHPLSEADDLSFNGGNVVARDDYAQSLVSAVPTLTSNPEPEFFKNKVLIVDDNLYNLTAIINMLQRHGLSADTAMDGNEAVLLVKKRMQTVQTTYKLIMMNYAMPNRNGGDAAKQIRMLLFNEAPTLEQPFICCLTSYAERGYQTEALKAAINCFLTKPLF